MLTAQLKLKENIAEYLLYMWQIENIIRAYNLDINKLDENIISKYDVSPEEKNEIINWYESLIEMMRHENKMDAGHLQINNNVIINLSDLNSELLKSPKFPDYSSEYYKTLPFIVELRAKAGENKKGEIETCVEALYSMMLLRLKGNEVSPDTAIAMKQI